MKKIKVVTTERNENPGILQINNMEKSTNQSRNNALDKLNLSKMTNKLFIPLLILCLSTNVQAADQAEFSIEAENSNSFVIQLTNVKQAHIEITLRDAHGEQLHTETLTQKSIKRRQYNLSNLPQGVYPLVVSYDEVTKIQPIYKEDNWLILVPEELQTIYRPILRQDDSYLDIWMTCFCDTEIRLEILDSEGHVLFKEFVKPEGYFQRRFNLSLLEEDLYTVKLSTVDISINKRFQEMVNWSPSIASFK